MANDVTQSVTVTLPCGFLVDGKLQTSAVIKPMTGKTRKMIARPQTRQNPSAIVDTILIECVESIGAGTKMRKSIADAMFVADRDALLLDIRKISMGKKITSHLTCPSCNEKITISIDLDMDIPVKKLSDMDYKIEDGIVTFVIENKHLDYEAVFRLPTGSDQTAIAPILKKNPVEANYMLYMRCLQSWNDIERQDIDPEFFDTLPLNILDDLDSQYSEILPGPVTRVPVNCVYCEAELPMGFEGSDFLFPQQRTGRT